MLSKTLAAGIESGGQRIGPVIVEIGARLITAPAIGRPEPRRRSNPVTWPLGVRRLPSGAVASSSPREPARTTLSSAARDSRTFPSRRERRGIIGRQLEVLGVDLARGAGFIRRLVVHRIDVRDRLDPGSSRPNRRVTLTGLATAGLETDAHVNLGRFRLRAAGHHAVFALIFGDDGVGRARTKTTERESTRSDRSSRKRPYRRASC